MHDICVYSLLVEILDIIYVTDKIIRSYVKIIFWLVMPSYLGSIKWLVVNVNVLVLNPQSYRGIGYHMQNHNEIYTNK